MAKCRILHVWALFSRNFLHKNLSAREGSAAFAVLKTPTIINRGMWKYSNDNRLKTLTIANDLVCLNEAPAISP
jgi:hypothetical protein